MYKIIVLYNTPADPAHFKDYYVNKHLPLAAKLPGLVASRHGFDLQGGGGPAPYFAVWEGEFADGAAAGAAMGSPIGQQVAADVANYADGGFTLFHYAAQEG